MGQIASVVEYRRRVMIDNRSGATAIEYALIAGGISIVIIVSVGLIGGSVRDLFNSVANTLN